jgi:hypothetical protein
MSKKKRYEYNDGSDREMDYREKKKAHRLQPYDRWRKNDYSTLNLTGEDHDDEEEWDTEN